MKLVAINEKFGLNEVFITIKEDDHENFYPWDSTNQTNDTRDEIKATTNLLNVVSTF